MLRRCLAAIAATALIASLGAVIPASATPPDSAPDTTPPQGQPRSTGNSTALGGTGVLRGPEVVLGKKSGRENYTVQLASPAVPERELNASAQRTPTAAAHRRALRSEQAGVTNTMADTLGRDVPLVHSFTEALNGFTVSLTAAEAKKVAQLGGVSSVHADTASKPLTSTGPSTIGAPSIWSGSAVGGGIGSRGEGVIVGIIDSGLNSSNPSFAASVPTSAGGDGYVHTNPYGAGNFKGMCDPASPQHNPAFTCNDKLIGAWDYTGAPEGLFYETTHGTHVASTAAGNQLDLEMYGAASPLVISGVAPHANIISYDVCVDYCMQSDTLAAVEQAIKDGVDVLNHSIGGSGPSDSWHTPYAVAFRNARAAGIDVAQAAGNDGPYESTIGRPADFPWLTTVGALENGRIRTTQLRDIDVPGDATLSMADMDGIAGSKSAADDDTKPIRAGETCGVPAATASAGLTGSLVMCERSVGNERAQSEWVLSSGGAGVIFYDADSGTPPVRNGQSHRIPVIFLNSEADELQTLVSLYSPVARIAPTTLSPSTIKDEVAAYSSRGPNLRTSTLSPHVSAPGSFVLAGVGDDSTNNVDFGYLSGTSMASPHVAGAYALLASVHPDWTPAQAQSALMSTADPTMQALGKTATVFEQGTGRIDVSKASQAGLVADETASGYAAADPHMGGDERSINAPAFVDDACPITCSFSVDLSATEIGAGTWTVAATAESGLSLSAPATFDATDTEERTLTVDAEFVGGGIEVRWYYGSLTLTPPSGSGATPMRVPVAAFPQLVDVPAEMTLRTSRSEGSMVHTSRFVAPEYASDSTVSVSGFSPRSPATTHTVLNALNPDNPFETVGRASTLSSRAVTIPRGTTRFIVELDSDALDLDLYVGTGNTPTSASAFCEPWLEGSRETCDMAVEAPEAFTVWVGVHAYELDPGSTQADYDLRVSTVAATDTTLKSATAASGSNLKTTLTWDDDRIDPGEVWFGMAKTQTPLSTRGLYTPITIGRTGTDVTRTSSATTTEFGDLMTHTVSFTPSLSVADETYTFDELAPAGVTVVDVLTAPAPVTRDGRKSSWSVTVPAGEAPTYTFRYTTRVSDSTLADGTALTHTVTHQRAGGPARTTSHAVTVSMPEAAAASPLVSNGEGVREVSVALERDWELAFMDGSAAVSRLTVDGGVYTVEAGGVLRFTPDTGRHGAPNPATYRITDAVGRHTTSTFSPNVWPAAPGYRDKATRGGSEQRITLDLAAWQSLTLLEAGSPVSILTTADGTYRVSGSSITFTAKQGMTGSGAPIRFRISDGYGRSADSTWSLFVDPDETGTQPTPTPTDPPTSKPTTKPAPKVTTRLTVKLTKKSQKVGTKKPAKARITVKSAKGQAKGKVVVRINGKAVKTIRITKNRTVTVKFSTKLKRGTKNVRVTFVPTVSGQNKSATARTTLRVVR